MNFRSRIRSQRRWAGWVLLLAGWLLAPAAARASCGDYVTTSHDMARPAAGQPSDETGLARHFGTQTPQHDDKPCSGPTCSRRSPAPPLAPVPPAPEREKDSAVVTPFGADLPLPSAVSAPDDAAAQPIRRSDPVYHPPR